MEKGFFPIVVAEKCGLTAIYAQLLHNAYYVKFHFKSTIGGAITMNLLNIIAEANFDRKRVYTWQIPINRFLCDSDESSQFVRNLCGQLLNETNRRDGLSGADFDVMFTHYDDEDTSEAKDWMEWSFSLRLYF